ncbi:MAG: gluconolactonase [Gemmatimonadetes bacterium]|nr:gluconolactonase [Gemmatimonadota bacterium]|tara:strand:- start:201 stop:1070 length:870 start_codon:yes stop_codon:yes gene_type:complete
MDEDDLALNRAVEGCSFTEGPAADHSGDLYFSDCPNNRIMVLRATGETEVWKEPSGRANGMNFDPDGRLVACCAQGEGGLRSVIRLATDGDHEVLASDYNGKPLNSPNDLCFDPEGRIYFTDPRYGDRSDCEQDLQAVYRIEHDGRLTRVIEDVETPNGILMTPDGRTIYLIDNNPEDWGARTLLSYGLTDEGDWARKAEVYDFSPGRGGDGMVLDIQGNAYVTAGDGESGGVYVFSPSGEHLAFIHTPEPPTNCTFGGPELRTLYITATTSVYSIECSEPGFLAYPRI